jgi:PAS domain S-box-containing protein
MIELFEASSQQDLFEQNIEESWVDPDCFRLVRQKLDAGEELVNFRAHRRRLDGSSMWVLMNSQIVEFEGESARAIWHNEISELVEAREQIENSKTELETRVNARTEELLKSEEKFRIFAELSSDWFWEMDRDLRYSFVSDTYSSVTGRQPEMLTGRTRREMYKAQIADEREDWEEHLAALDNHEDVDGFVFSYIRTDGTERKLTISGRAKFSADGEFAGYQGIGNDITDRLKLEYDLRHSQARYQLIANMQTELVTRFTVDGDLTYANRAYCDFVDETEESLVGTSIYAEIPSDEVERVKQYFQTFSKDNPVQTNENRLQRHDGEQRDFEWINYAQFDENDVADRFQSVGRDVTNRKLAESALKASEARYQGVVNGQSELVTRFRPDGEFTFVNDAYCRFVGRTEEETLSASIFEDVPETELHSLKEYLGSFTTDEPVRNIENKLKRHDGELRDIEWQDTAYFDDNGNVVEFQPVARDVTERKRIERELIESEERLKWQVDELRDREQRLEDQAEELVGLAENISITSNDLDEANKQKDKLFSIIAHDLKGPFSTLLGYSNMLALKIESFSQPQILEAAQSMSMAAQRVFDLLTNLLEWSRLQMEGTAFNPEPIGFAPICEQNLNLFSPLAEEKGIKLVGPENSSITLFADRHMFNAIFRNMVNNALKFTPRDGQVAVDCEVLGGFARFSIQDTGVGMSPEKLSKLFVLGEKTSTVGTNGEVGTGLGLQLCKDLVAKCGGELSVDSEIGEGTTFTFTMPLPETADSDVRATAAD